MRCARCDGLAVPQSVGQLPDGRVAFGWCLNCMEEEECTHVTVARGGPALQRWLAHRPSTAAERRAHALAIVALMIGVWAVTLLALGTLRADRPSRVPGSPSGKGASNILLAGGAALGVTSLTLGAIAMTRADWFWRVLEWALFACAMLVLVLGVVHYDPRRAPWLVVLAAFAIVLSGLVHQRRRLHASHPRPDHRASSPGPAPDAGEDRESV